MLGLNKNQIFDEINLLFDKIIQKLELSAESYYKNLELILLLSMSFFLYKHELKTFLVNLKKYNFFEKNDDLESKILQVLEQIMEQETMNHSEIDKIYLEQLEIWNLFFKIKNQEVQEFSVKEIFHILNLLLENKVEYNSSKKNFLKQYKLENDQNQNVIDYQKLDIQKIYLIKLSFLSY